MIRHLRFCLSCLLPFVVGGCELESKEVPGPSGKVTKISGNFQIGPAPQGSTPAAGSAGQPNGGAIGQPAAIPAAPAFPIRLSAGTALPQTGPEGALMSFSIDYQAGEYRPAEDVRCVLVIEAAGGKRVEEPAQIAASGTWALFVGGWDPEAGPFQAHVEEISGAGSRRHISAKVPLQ